MLTQAATTTTTTPPPNLEYVHRAAWKAGVIGALNVILIIVAVRITLMIAIVGAIVLSVTAIQAPDPWRLGALAIYAALVVIPTVFLASRR